jgi:exopolysaccharide production protein ExoQ
MQSTSAVSDTGRKNVARFGYFLIFSAVALEGAVFRLGESRLNSLLFAALSFAAFFFAIVSRNGHLLIKFNRASLSFGIYLIFAAVSSAWSYIGFDSAVQLAPIFLFLSAVAFVSVDSEIDFDAMMVNVGIWVCIASWLLYLVLPSVAASMPYIWRLNGIMAHPQRLSILLSTSLICWSSIVFLKRERLGFFRQYIAPLLLIATLLAAKTRAFTVFLILALATMFVLGTRKDGKYFLALAVLAIAIVPAVIYPEVLAELLERDGTNSETLSGRTTIWENTLSMIAQKPYLGHGFGSFYSDLTSGFFANYVAAHAHNDFLNILFETGGIGATLMLLFLATAFVHFGKTKDRSGFYILFFYLLCGTMGVLLGGKATLPMLIVLMKVGFSMRSPQVKDG